MNRINKHELRDLILDGITEEELKKYDYSHVTDMSFMFYECSKLESVPLFDTSKVTDMRSMFYRCSNLESVPLFDTSKVTDICGMFHRCSNLRSIQMDCSLINFDEINSPYLKENYPEHFI